MMNDYRVPTNSGHFYSVSLRETPKLFIINSRGVALCPHCIHIKTPLLILITLLSPVNKGVFILPFFKTNYCSVTIIEAGIGFCAFCKSNPFSCALSITAIGTLSPQYI